MPLDATQPNLPPAQVLKDAARIVLTRQAESSGARALAHEVELITRPLLERKRPLGPDGIVARQTAIGTVLIGLLKGAFEGTAVSARRTTSAPMWAASPIGYNAFWAQADALRAAGLVGELPGNRFKTATGMSGHPTKLWATEALLEMAARHGVVKDAFADSWRRSERALAARPSVTPDKLIESLAVPLRRLKAEVPCPLPATQLAEAERLRAQVLRLNEQLAAHDISGCLPPVLRRRFYGDLRLGGRFWAVGTDSYQVAKLTERRRWRIDGEPLVEVDIKASTLSVLLASIGQAIPADPYQHGALAALPREAVKAWVIQSLFNGRPKVRWTAEDKATVRAVPVKQVREAALRVYPALEDLQTLLPGDLAEAAPADRQGWVVGQWLSGLEAQVLSGALEHLLDEDVVALPLHDALFVPEGAVAAAQQALEGAFEGLLGTPPQLAVKGLS